MAVFFVLNDHGVVCMQFLFMFMMHKKSISFLKKKRCFILISLFVYAASLKLYAHDKLYVNFHFLCYAVVQLFRL